MIKKYLILTMLTFALGACATDDDAWLVKERATVPPISGGFHFKQYVVLNPGDAEVLGDEGVLYISPKMLTDDQVKAVFDSPQGKKHAMYGDVASAYFHLNNACLSAVRDSSGKAGDAAGYLSLVITDASTRKDGKSIRLRLYAWPDFWYDWNVEPTGDGYVVEDSSTQQAWGWNSSRIVLTKDPAVTLDTCVQYNKS